MMREMGAEEADWVWFFFFDLALLQIYLLYKNLLTKKQLN